MSEGISRKEVEEEEKQREEQGKNLKNEILNFLREHPDKMFTASEICENIGIEENYILYRILVRSKEIDGIRSDKKNEIVYGIRQS